MELDTNSVNLRPSAQKSAADRLRVCVYFLAQMVEVNELTEAQLTFHMLRSQRYITRCPLDLLTLPTEKCNEQETKRIEQSLEKLIVA